MTRDRDEGRPFRLLTVCTANQCRSPMAEVIARDLLRARHIDSVVSSRGVMEGGVAASPGAVRAMHRRGLDLTAHRSRTIDLDAVDGSDLIVTMERRHISAVADLDLDAVGRTFTLPELAELATIVGARHPDRSVQDWIVGLDHMRTPTSVLSVDTGDDLPDPMGGPRTGYRKAAEHIEELLVVVLDAAFPR